MNPEYYTNMTTAEAITDLYDIFGSYGITVFEINAELSLVMRDAFVPGFARILYGMELAQRFNATETDDYHRYIQQAKASAKM